MRVIFEHTGDERSSGEQCRKWRTDDTEALEQHGLRDDLSKVEGVQRLWKDKLEQYTVELESGDEFRLPNVEVVEVRRQA